MLSNSTGATSRKDAKHSSGNNGNHHLSAWVRAKGNNNGNINSNNTSAGGGRARSKWSHPGAAGQQHQQTAAPVRLVAGERGPKVSCVGHGCGLLATTHDKINSVLPRLNQIQFGSPRANRALGATGAQVG